MQQIHCNVSVAHLFSVFQSKLKKTKTRFYSVISCLLNMSMPLLPPNSANLIALPMLTTYNSVGKESTCNAGDPGLIPGSGRSTGEGIAYPLPVFLGFPCGSADKESACNAGDPVRSLGWKDTLVKGKAIHSSIMDWRIPWTSQT